MGGSNLDLFRDFDSLLIATPDPRDAAVTFLVARYHVAEAAIKAGLERGGRAAGKPITWKMVDGRPVGIRQATTAPNAPVFLNRDDRIVVLPRPSMAIMATAAYANQLLGQDVISPGDGGAPSAVDGGTATRRKPVRWKEIVERIEAEESVLPDDAVFSMSTTNLVSAALASDWVVPPTRGVNEDFAVPPAPEDTSPQSLGFVAGLDTPYFEIDADFKTASAADRWAREIPRLKHKALINPVVLLGGMSPLIQRSQLSRIGETSLQVRAESSTEEIQRLLNLAANLVRAAQAARQF
jgi:hypothetical protein